MRLGLTLVPLFLVAAAAPAGDFGSDAVAFLQKHCVACHGEKKKSSGVALHATTDDAGLLKNRKVFTRVLRVLEAGEMPPKGKPRPTMEDVERFTQAVARTFDHADQTAKADPGRVTIRRLNKTEYANTIR